MNFIQSEKLFEKSGAIIPGGVNSPVRAFGAVGGKPIFIQRAKGAWLYDEDGNRYVDFINSWGPMILGHAHEEIIAVVKEKLDDGFSFGAPTSQELAIASQIQSMAPWVEMVRLVSSGTEACLSALRLARGYTGKNKFIKFAGCYHGHADAFLVKAGSGVMSFGIPGSAGVPASVTEHTLPAEFNNLAGVRALFDQYGSDMAAIIVEPIAGNMGCILPEPGFLEGLRALCNQYGAVLIFDEVMTGFRLAPGGAAEVTKVIPDLVTYGKVIGGGMPVGAFGGKRSIMEKLAPLGPVYQAGTLSGNPIAVSCGLATLKYLMQHPSIYSKIENTTKTIQSLLIHHFNTLGIEHVVNQKGSMISIHFGTSEMKNYTQAGLAANHIFNAFFHHMLRNEVYLPPSAFETWFISNAVDEEALTVFEKALKKFEWS